MATATETKTLAKTIKAKAEARSAKDAEAEAQRKAEAVLSARAKLAGAERDAELYAPEINAARKAAGRGGEEYAAAQKKLAQYQAAHGAPTGPREGYDAIEYINLDADVKRLFSIHLVLGQRADAARATEQAVRERVKHARAALEAAEADALLTEG